MLSIKTLKNVEISILKVIKKLFNPHTNDSHDIRTKKKLLKNKML